MTMGTHSRAQYFLLSDAHILTHWGAHLQHAVALSASRPLSWPVVMPDLTTDPQYSMCGLYCVSRQGSGSAPRSVMSLPRVFRPSALKSLAA